MPISEKDIFATLMQDPNHAYQPLEKVWAEAVQRARQFRNNEKALALAFDTSPALAKLSNFIQKAPPRINPEDTPDDFGERLKENLDSYQTFNEAASTLNELFKYWDERYGQFDAGQQIRMGKGRQGHRISLEAFNDLLHKVQPQLENLISFVQELHENPGLSYADAIKGKDDLKTFIDSSTGLRDDGTLYPRVLDALENYQNDDFVKQNNAEGQVRKDRGTEAEAQQAGGQAISGDQGVNFFDTGAAGVEEPEEEEPDTTYDEFHPAEGESYPLDNLDPDGEGHSIHSVMRELLTRYGHFLPVDLEGGAKEYYELIDPSNRNSWKFSKNADEHPDINGETFAKLQKAGLVTGSSARGKWQWTEGTEALQELMKNMDRVRKVTERPDKPNKYYKGQLHPALVDWLIDANAKGKLQPSYSEQDIAFHQSLGIGAGIQATPNEDLEQELIREEDEDRRLAALGEQPDGEDTDEDEAEDEESEEEEEEEGENPWLQYENPPLTGLIQSTGDNWLTPAVIDPPSAEEREETVGNLEDSTHADARYFPRKPSGDDGTKPYLFPRIDGEEFNPLEGDIDSLPDNFKKILKNFHAMNYKHDDNSLPKIFGTYDETQNEAGELLNPFTYELKPEEWDDNKKLAYNKIRDNIGIHEGWLQGMIMAGLIPDTSSDVIYDPTITHPDWDDKDIKKGHWNWVEALRGLGILDTDGYPKFSSIDHSAGNLDAHAGHGLDFVGVARTGGRRGAGGGEVEGGGSFHTALNRLLTSEGIATEDDPYWAQAERERKTAFAETFGGRPADAERAWEMYQTSRGFPTGRMAGPSEDEPYREDVSVEDVPMFHEFIQNILAEGHEGQSPEEVREKIFGPAVTTEGTEEVVAPEAVVPDAGAVEEGGLGLESPDWGTTPGDITQPVVPETEEARLAREAAQFKQDQINQKLEAERVRLAELKEKRINALMEAYPGAEEYKDDHKYELENDDKFLASEWANEIKRRASVGIKAQASAEKEEAQAAKEAEKEASGALPMDETERKRLIQQIVNASEILHPGLEMSTEKQQLLEHISQTDEKKFRAEHEKVVNALETKKQADAKLQRTRDANNLDGFHGIKPLASQQQPTEDDLVMQIRRIERWKKEHGSEMSDGSHKKLEEYWSEVNQFAANLGFDVDAQVNEDKEAAGQVGANYYGSSDWLDEVGKMHVDEIGRKGNYDRQVAQGAELRGNRNYKPWLVIKYDRNGFGTFHDLRQRDEEGDYGKRISPESLSFNEDEHYFDYKQDKEDLSQHPNAFNKFWSKIDRANFRPIDRRGFVERHGESGITANTTHALLGERGTQTGWYHPESGSWVNPHRYREVRQSLEQAGTGAGMMILNGSQFTGNHKRTEDNVHPKYGFAHRGDKALADAGDDTNDFSYYVDGEGNIAHSNANWDAVKQRDTNQIQDVNSVVHDWHSQNMNNMVIQDPNSWKSPDGQSVLPGKIIYPRQSGGEPLQNMRLLKDVKDFDSLARRRKQTGYDPSQMKNVGRTGLAADELGGMGQWWGAGAEARQKYFGALDYIGSGVLGWWGELIVGGKRKSDRMIQRARKEYKLHSEAEKRTKNVMDNIKWHGEPLRYLSPGENSARQEDLGRLRNHLSQQRIKHRNLETEASSRKDTAGSQQAKEQHLKYSNDLNSLTGLNHEFDSHWKHINDLYGQHMGGDAVHASMAPNRAEGSGAWADIFAQPSQQAVDSQRSVSSGLIGNAPASSEAPPSSGGAGLMGGSSQGEVRPREQTSSGIGLIG